MFLPLFCKCELKTLSKLARSAFRPGSRFVEVSMYVTVVKLRNKLCRHCDAAEEETALHFKDNHNM